MPTGESAPDAGSGVRSSNYEGSIGLVMTRSMVKLTEALNGVVLARLRVERRRLARTMMLLERFIVAGRA